MKKWSKWIAVAMVAVFGLALAAQANPYKIFAGDGSDEPGFVPPPGGAKNPPPPPREVSSAETLIAGGGPVVPMSRTEAKKSPRPPVVFTKLRTEKNKLDWAATPNDVNNLLKKMKGMMDVNYSMDIKLLSEIDPDPEKNPVLFRSGHYRFEYSPEERAKIRQYLLDGGMLILNTGLGSKPFYDSAVKELKEILPEVNLQRLSADHPVFHAYYDVDRVRYRPGVYQAGYRGNEPWVDGLTINCRTVALVSRWCMAVGWEENEDDSYQAYVSEDAQKLGVNLFAYATAQRAWVKNAAHMMQFQDAEKHSGDKMFLGQVVYDGEWKTRHVGLSVLLHQFNLKTDVPVQFALKEMRFSDPSTFNAPLLYITGHEDFRLNNSEATALKQYVLNGGFIFAEACCGRKGFDHSFRQQMSQILPENPLQLIPKNSQVYNMPNKVESLGVTPALASELGGRSTTEPKLYGMEIDGHYGVIYSSVGMAGGWEMSQNPYAHGYDDVGSFLLGQNILMYAITQ